MRYMFTMMNNARLGVGVEGLGLAERSLPGSPRLRPGAQAGPRPGRGAGREVVDRRAPRRAPDAADDAGLHRGDARARLQGGRADRLRPHSAESDVDRTAAQETVDLLIPLTKSYCTDVAETVTSIGIQVHGGMGYIEETGVAQHYRDAKITQIYEGTNGIQAMDLVGRKLPMRAGGVYQRPASPACGPPSSRARRRRRRRSPPSTASCPPRSTRSSEATSWILEQGPGRSGAGPVRGHAVPAPVRHRRRRLADGPARPWSPSGCSTPAPATPTPAARPSWSPPASSPSTCCRRSTASSPPVTAGKDDLFALTVDEF